MVTMNLIIFVFFDFFETQVGLSFEFRILEGHVYAFVEGSNIQHASAQAE